ncbi:MAG: hypothetical protein ACJ0DH_10250 [bacterium]
MRVSTKHRESEERKQLNPLEQRFLEESLKVILQLRDELYARFGGIP